nr:hypothetical protein [Tanacetum cinerariifolium]
MAFKSRSNTDHTRLISKSIFITNFPDVTTSKDLWVLCQSYGTVVDVSIPNRMSKAGKRFAFVRFIKVDNVERLVGNLCTLWIGRKHLQANVDRFERDSIPSKRVPHKSNHVAPTPTSFISAVKGVSSLPIPLASSSALVLDDSCMVARDLDNFVMGEVRQFSSINNLRVLLHNEGFMDIEIVYLGGLWVMIKLGSAKTKLKFMKHTGLLLGSQWGEVMELEDGNEDLFSRKRLCIKTKHSNNILDSFKIIVKGKVFHIRAKELFVWSPSFKEVPEVVHCSDDESVKNEADINVVNNTVNNEEEGSDSEAEYFSDLEVKYFWGNYQFDHIASEALGYSGGILCVWDSNVFHKKHHIISDNFVALYGTWIPKKIQLLIISVYAPQSYASKRKLWNFIVSLINRWNRECMVMGDFNEVRCKEDRLGSIFHAQ